MKTKVINMHGTIQFEFDDNLIDDIRLANILDSHNMTIRKDYKAYSINVRYIEVFKVRNPEGLTWTDTNKS